MDNNEENNDAPVEEAAEAAAPEEAAPAAEEAAAPAAPEAPAASGGGGNPLQEYMEKVGLGELAQKDQYLLLGGALGALIALFLPWFGAGDKSVNSFEEWHGIVGLLSIVATVALIVIKNPWEWAGVVVGVLVAVLAIIATPGPDGIEVKIGVYVFLAGNIAVGLMCIDKAKIESIKVQLKINK